MTEALASSRRPSLSPADRIRLGDEHSAAFDLVVDLGDEAFSFAVTHRVRAAALQDDDTASFWDRVCQQIVQINLADAPDPADSH